MYRVQGKDSFPTIDSLLDRGRAKAIELRKRFKKNWTEALFGLCLVLLVRSLIVAKAIGALWCVVARPPIGTSDVVGISILSVLISILVGEAPWERIGFLRVRHLLDKVMGTPPVEWYQRLGYGHYSNTREETCDNATYIVAVIIDDIYKACDEVDCSDLSFFRRECAHFNINERTLEAEEQALKAEQIIRTHGMESPEAENVILAIYYELFRLARDPCGSKDVHVPNDDDRERRTTGIRLDATTAELEDEASQAPLSCPSRKHTA